MEQTAYSPSPPVPRRAPSRGQVRVRPWPWVSWWYSLVFILPVMIIAYMVARGALTDPPKVGFSVTDPGTGQAIAGALVTVGTIEATTAADGSVSFDAEVVGTAPVMISAEGYHPYSATIPANADEMFAVQLRSSTVAGTVTDAGSGKPLAGATVTVVGHESLTTTTGADGKYTLADVPEGATLQITADGYGTVQEAIGERNAIDAALRFARVTGTVVDAQNQPIAGAVVIAGDQTTTTRRDGTFVLESAADATEVRVSASGYADATVAIAADRTVAAQLEKVMIKAAYINQFGLSEPGVLDDLIALINRTELNALVVDIKQDSIFYDTQVEFFRNVPNMIVPLYDPVKVVQKLKDNNIYTIARQVIFQDPLVAEAYPELSVHIEGNPNELWRSWDGVAWVNAFHEELWDANIELALEAISLGFEEIQYDYVRFPSDGDLTTADFGPDYSQEAREGAITGFIARSAEAIRPTGAKLAVDIFGIITLYDDDQGIGQRFTKIAPLVDYLCMMIYPSHFEEGNIKSAPGHPNDYPYETIYEALERAAEMAPDHVHKFRPWLQDFTYPIEGFMPYGPEEVRAQIDAAEDFGVNGWLLWDPTNTPTEEALKPE